MKNKDINFENLHVVGLPYHEYYKYADFISQDAKIFLKREKDNTHDKNAIQVFLDPSEGPNLNIIGLAQIGYIKHNQAKELAPHMDKGKLTYLQANYQAVKKLVTVNKLEPHKEIMVLSLKEDPQKISPQKRKSPKGNRKRINVWI